MSTSANDEHHAVDILEHHDVDILDDDALLHHMFRRCGDV